MNKQTVAEHLKAHHEKMAGFHRAHGAHHSKMAKHHHAAAAHHDGELSKLHKSMAAAHESMAQLSEEHSAGYQEMADLIDSLSHKVVDTRDLDKLVPTRVRGIASADAPPEAFGSAAAMGVTAIPRVGAPKLGEGQRRVPLELAKMVEIDEEE